MDATFPSSLDIILLFLTGTLFGYAVGIIKHKRMRERYFKAIDEIAAVKAKCIETEARLDFEQYRVRNLDSRLSRVKNALELCLPNKKPAPAEFKKEAALSQGGAQ